MTLNLANVFKELAENKFWPDKNYNCVPITTKCAQLALMVVEKDAKAKSMNGYYRIDLKKSARDYRINPSHYAEVKKRVADTEENK